MDTQIGLRQLSATTLRRIELNDPSLERLHLSGTAEAPDAFAGAVDMQRVGHFFLFPISPALHMVDLQRLGDAIGANTSLKTICFNDVGEMERSVDRNMKFFRGLQRNTSIQELSFANCGLADPFGIGQKIMREFTFNGKELIRAYFSNCVLGGTGARMLCDLVAFAGVKDVLLEICGIDDALLKVLVGEIRKRRLGQNLVGIDLGGNVFGLDGCQALATLLRDPQCDLQAICLDGNNNIDDDCAEVLANAVKGNDMLSAIFLHGNDSITEGGWKAFCQAMFDPSSIDSVYHSNHSLECLSDDAPSELAFLLDLNRDPDKKRVAITKIILAQHHMNIDMEPFLQWDLRMMPVAVRWFDSARSTMDTDSKEAAVDPKGLSESIDALKLSAIYQFARALPLMFVPSNTGSKRKRDEAS